MRRLRWIPPLLWAAVIFGFSALPARNVPGHFGNAPHFFEYAVFGALLAGALAPGRASGRALAIALVLASSYGVSDEIHQHFVAGRTPDVYDWGLDTLGAAAGAATYLLARAGLAARRRSLGD